MLYIHIPYCHQKCTYCAFYSTATRKGREEYAEALCKEISDRAERNADGSKREVKTLYFGGGTPTLLPPRLLEKILRRLEEEYDLTRLEESTIEANPEDLTAEYLSELRGLRIFDRISIGIQSFDDGDLKRLNRACDSRKARESLDRVMNSGFKEISLDLIYGLPEQEESRWRKNLENLVPYIGSGLTHLSAYALSVEPGTMLERQIEMGRTKPAEEEIVLTQYEILLDWCRKNGFVQYEISSFCKPGHHSRHNSRYWDRTPYIGFGSGAHSFDGTHRRWNVSNAQAYSFHVLHGGPYSEVEELTLKDAHNEYIMTALRTVEGIEKAKIAAPFVCSLKRDISCFLNTGLLTETETHYKPTHEGLLHADGIAEKLFLD